MPIKCACKSIPEINIPIINYRSGPTGLWIFACDIDNGKFLIYFVIQTMVWISCEGPIACFRNQKYQNCISPVMGSNGFVLRAKRNGGLAGADESHLEHYQLILLFLRRYEFYLGTIMMFLWRDNIPRQKMAESPKGGDI